MRWSCASGRSRNLNLAKAQAEERFTAERSRYRLELEEVHADLIALQASAASMARRVAATIGSMNSAEDLTAAGGRPALSTAVTAAAVAESTGTVLPVTDGAAVGEADEAEDAAAALASEAGVERAEPNEAEETFESSPAVEVEIASLGSGDQPQSAETPPDSADAETATLEDHPGRAPATEPRGFLPERSSPSPGVLNQPRQPNQPATYQPSTSRRRQPPLPNRLPSPHLPSMLGLPHLLRLLKRLGRMMSVRSKDRGR